MAAPAGTRSSRGPALAPPVSLAAVLTNLPNGTHLHRRPHAQQLGNVRAARHRRPQLCDSISTQPHQRGCDTRATAGASAGATDGCSGAFCTTLWVCCCQLGAELGGQAASQRSAGSPPASLGCRPPQQLKKVCRAPAVGGAVGRGDIVEQVGAGIGSQLQGEGGARERGRRSALPWPHGQPQPIWVVPAAASPDPHLGPPSSPPGAWRQQQPAAAAGREHPSAAGRRRLGRR